MPPHPIGIKPEGMLLIDGCSGGMGIRNQGLGSLKSLSDALLLDIFSRIDPRSLVSLSQSSKACYCFCATEDLWKAHVLEEFEGGFTWDTWHRTWRAAYAASKARAALRNGSTAGNGDAAGAVAHSGSAADHEGQQHQAQDSKRMRVEAAGGGSSGSTKGRKGASKGRGQKRKEAACVEEQPLPPESRIKVQGFYSDLLYQPWHCATAELQPEWLEVNNVDRKRNLSPTAFREQYELQNKPVILVDGAAKWPARKKWTMESLEQAFAGKDIIAGNYPMPFSTYSAYAYNTIDEMPLYLFDKEFLAKAPQLGSDFTVPSVFDEDLFGLMGSARPDFRWLIVGPARSGSSFHVDPNCTSAWNAVVRGSKKWIMFPPGQIPPGVHPSPDGADVATPVSVMEWFLNFYAAAREAKVPPLECVVNEGEVIFVPRGWWHACLNLETMTIAVTQNYVSSANVYDVLRFIRPGRSDLVSGCKLEDRAHLHGRFLDALKQHRPDVVQKVESLEEARKAKKAQESKLSLLFNQSKGAAAEGGSSGDGAGAPQAKPASTFCFNFNLK